MCVNISHQWVNQPLLRNHLCNLDKYYTHARAHTKTATTNICGYYYYKIHDGEEMAERAKRSRIVSYK